ncbi:MAG: hypothetical protein LCI00_24715 [Chloroflexi bacterium]|nr:hypothetical protein [Chloroflexota bacterium]MCC6895811.1 hypothetical protein [Anaerolineae bacterium]
MPQPLRIPYSGVGNATQAISLMPRLSMRLFLGNQYADVTGLVDSGASVNVLPYTVGLTLGADWNSQPQLASLGGNLSVTEVRALAVMAYHPELTDDMGTELLFAWTRTDNAPLIFGQINFFLQFDLCFFRSEQVFEITPR